jgi:RNA polymerase sigma-70 factor (ECF subfamily)
MLGDPHDAQDATQECFARLAQADASSVSYIGGWLHRVAANLCRDHIKSDVRRRDREEVFAETVPVAVQSSWDDLQQHIDEAIEALPEGSRYAIQAHFLEGRTHEDIARELNITRSGVTHRIERGIKQVRERGVLVGVPGLMVSMQQHLVEEAPTAVKLALGRLAVAGPAAGTGVAVAGGVVSIGKIIAVIVSLAVAGASAWFVMRPTEEQGPETTGNAGAAETASIREILREQQLSFIRLRSLDYTVHFKSVYGEYYADGHDPGIKPGDWEEGQVRFRFEGDKYRKDSDFGSPQSGHSINTTYAYDGAELQRFAVVSKRLNILGNRDERPPYGGVNHYLMPYGFAYGNGEWAFEQLSENDRWSFLADAGEILGEEIVNGRECVVISFPTPYRLDLFSKSTYSEVAFAEDLNWFPVRRRDFTVDDGAQYFECTVNEVRIVEDDAGPIAVPINWVSKRMTSDGLVRFTKESTIESDSLSVNPEFPRDTFRIPLSMVRYFDVGSPVPLKLDEDSPLDSAALRESLDAGHNEYDRDGEGNQRRLTN